MELALAAPKLLLPPPAPALPEETREAVLLLLWAAEAEASGPWEEEA